MFILGASLIVIGLTGLATRSIADNAVKIVVVGGVAYFVYRKLR